MEGNQLYHLHVMGVAHDSLSAAMGSIRNIPELCTLVHELTPLDEPGPEYTGPLLEAPVGFYHLWIGRPAEPLTITEDKIILGNRLLARRTLRMSGKTYLEERVRKEFSELLARSERVLGVYQDGTGHQQYRLLWPDTAVPVIDGYEYLGRANLDTGEIT